MSGPSPSGGARITDKRQLVEYLEAGNKPESAWRIGTEHEKFVFRHSDHHRVAYDGADGIHALLDGLMPFGWEPVLDNGKVIALAANNASLSLEPGGQFELSGAPLETIHQSDAELVEHLRQAGLVAQKLGVGMLGIGFDPVSRREDVPWMPKSRYAVMRGYMPKKGGMGLDMMLRTCTVQVNLDFADEADMVKKFRMSLALQPVATALFANSPFVEGKPSGFQTYRANVWTDTDPDRTGLLPFVFEPGMGFERYVDYMLDVPMYFVYRDGRYIDVAGQSFREFLVGRLPGLRGEVPNLSDWSDHLTTAFPEVRLKRFLEMRGADVGPVPMLNALPALWTGLFYDQAALDAAYELGKDWTLEERESLRRDVPRHGFKTKLGNRTVQDLAREMMKIARGGLERRARLDAQGRDESHFLDPLTEIAESGRSLADDMLTAYETRWGGKVDPVFTEKAY